MIPFKTLRTLDHFAVIQPPTNAKYIFFQGGLLFFQFILMLNGKLENCCCVRLI